MDGWMDNWSDPGWEGECMGASNVNNISPTILGVSHAQIQRHDQKPSSSHHHHAHRSRLCRVKASASSPYRKPSRHIVSTRESVRNRLLPLPLKEESHSALKCHIGLLGVPKVMLPCILARLPPSSPCDAQMRCGGKGLIYKSHTLLVNRST